MSVVRPTEDIAFALTADGGGFEKKTLLLVRSLRDHYPDAPVLTFIPEEPNTPLTDDARGELEDKTTVRTGDFPLDAYPHTAFQRAYELAAEEFDVEYYAALDSDAVVLNPITLPRGDADLYAAPMYMGVWQWQSASGITADWHQLFDHYDIPIPEERNTGLTDDVQMWPAYYNSGVMVTTDDDLPSRFLQMNVDVFGGDLTERDPGIETEQVVLALLAHDPDVDFCELDAKQNWMMGGFHSVPDDVEVLHYQFLDTLATLSNTTLEEQLETYGAKLNPRWRDHLIRRLSYFVFRGGKWLPPRVQRRASRELQPVFDWNNPSR